MTADSVSIRTWHPRVILHAVTPNHVEAIELNRFGERPAQNYEKTTDSWFGQRNVR